MGLKDDLARSERRHYTKGWKFDSISGAMTDLSSASSLLAISKHKFGAARRSGPLDEIQTQMLVF